MGEKKNTLLGSNLNGLGIQPEGWPAVPQLTTPSAAGSHHDRNMYTLVGGTRSADGAIRLKCWWVAASAGARDEVVPRHDQCGSRGVIMLRVRAVEGRLCVKAHVDHWHATYTTSTYIVDHKPTRTRRGSQNGSFKLRTRLGAAP